MNQWLPTEASKQAVFGLDRTAEPTRLASTPRYSWLWRLWNRVLRLFGRYIRVRCVECGTVLRVGGAEAQRYRCPGHVIVGHRAG